MSPNRDKQSQSCWADRPQGRSVCAGCDEAVPWGICVSRCPQRGPWERKVPAAALGACTALPTVPSRARERDGTGMPVGPAVCTCGAMCACMETQPAWLLDSRGAMVLLQLQGPLRKRTRQDAAMDVGPEPGQPHVSPAWGRASIPPPSAPWITVPAWQEPTAAGMGGVCTNVSFIKAFLRRWHLGSGCTERPLRGRGQRWHMQLHETQYKRYKRVKTATVVQCVKINNWGLSGPSPKQGACVWPFLWRAG